MAEKPFDPTLKEMVETEPESWPGFLGRPTGPTRVLDADTATVSGAADKALHVGSDPPYLLHLFCWGCATRRPWRLTCSGEWFR